ncbi:MAG: twin-arginine translocation signal domain-containing protein, partial [Rhodocyclaceae bacterium]|nr:twin-arginine translocation signal domain-containing protein [Rhodocyclaceae bacterium]
MSFNTLPKIVMPVRLSRRRFVQGLAAGGVISGFPFLALAGKEAMPSTHTGPVPELMGPNFDLVIA